MRRSLNLPGLFVGLLLAFGGFLLVGPAPKALAEVYTPGCYVFEGNRGMHSVSCENYTRLLNYSFEVQPDVCYFGWSTGMGVTPPVAIDCQSGPARDDATPRLPRSNTPGDVEEGASANDQITRDPSFGGTTCNGGQVDPNNPGTNCIVDDVNVVISVLAAGVGVVVIMSIILAGIQYITAGGDPQQISKAKTRIRNAIVALLAFTFLYAFLQWVIPGGFL